MHASLVFGYAWFLISGYILILLHIYMQQKVFYFNDKNVALPFTSVILQPYLPITGTSLQRPLDLCTQDGHCGEVRLCW